MKNLSFIFLWKEIDEKLLFVVEEIMLELVYLNCFGL